MKWSRTFDWRFLIALVLLTLVAYLTFSGVTSARDNLAKGDRIDALIAQRAEQDAANDRERQLASEERAQLLSDQQQLINQIEQWRGQQTALLNWLRKNGIEIPVRFVILPSGGTTSGGAGSAGGGSRTPSGRTGSGGSNTPGKANPPTNKAQLPTSPGRRPRMGATTEQLDQTIQSSTKKGHAGSKPKKDKKTKRR